MLKWEHVGGLQIPLSVLDSKGHMRWLSELDSEQFFSERSSPKVKPISRSLWSIVESNFKTFLI